MLSKEITVNNPTGLHARPASEFTRCAAKFHSGITVCKTGGQPVSAKSMILVLSQSIVQGTTITITANGEDELAAIEALSLLVENLSE
ncbi:MAG: HPr family phosphocarrier protein [Clostridia bacterium]